MDQLPLSQVLHDEAYDFVAEAEPRAETTTRKRRTKIIVLDESIELASTVLREWQLEYPVLMKRQKQKHVSKAERAVFAANAQSFTWGYSGSLIHTGLQASFGHPFCASVVDGTLMESADVPMEFPMDNFVTEIEQNRQALLSQGEVELGRRAMSADADLDLTRDSLLPWNIPKDAALANSISGHRSLTLSAQNTPQSFQFLSTPILRSRQTSLRPSNRVSTTLGMGGLERVESEGICLKV